ncbi:MAG: hypothetical protein NWE95_03755 [Candidatus Bathyarchaeota archaeon]|nr:hypothetical protein [Candidatus Bathyarchaeota archaeon]
MLNPKGVGGIGEKSLQKHDDFYYDHLLLRPLKEGCCPHGMVVVKTATVTSADSLMVVVNRPTSRH